MRTRVEIDQEYNLLLPPYGDLMAKFLVIQEDLTVLQKRVTQLRRERASDDPQTNNMKALPVPLPAEELVEGA